MENRLHVLSKWIFTISQGFFGNLGVYLIHPPSYVMLCAGLVLQALALYRSLYPSHFSIRCAVVFWTLRDAVWRSVVQ